MMRARRRHQVSALDRDWGYGWLGYMPNLTKGLVARGYSNEEIKGILGGNGYASSNEYSATERAHNNSISILSTRRTGFYS
jgi:hypothetical protein